MTFLRHFTASSTNTANSTANVFCVRKTYVTSRCKRNQLVIDLKLKVYISSKVGLQGLYIPPKSRGRAWKKIMVLLSWKMVHIYVKFTWKTNGQKILRGEMKEVMTSCIRLSPDFKKVLAFLLVTSTIVPKFSDTNAPCIVYLPTFGLNLW